MPRIARRDAPGAIHHVILRGIERRVVFVDDGDRTELLRRLGIVLPSCDVGCFGFALMPNHLHLVLRTGATQLAVAMARIATGYAGYFNRRHDRSGHLFQNRYKAIPVESDEQLRVLIRYVHLNPVRAGIVGGVGALEAWPWTGHASLVGDLDACFLSVGDVLSLFGPSRAGARTALREWMSLPSDARQDEAVLGSVRALEQLVEDVARECGVLAEHVRGGLRSRDISRARAVVAHLAYEALGFSEAVIAAHLGVGQTSIGRARDRGRSCIAQGSPGLVRLALRLGVGRRSG
jgi:REP element-mobilizing transposase RayT